MRLIDADELMDAILWSKRINSECALEENAVDTYDNGQQETFELVIKMVEDRPTEYDVDEVVEQLENDEKHTFDGCINKMYAIEIVKGGGLNG